MNVVFLTSDLAASASVPSTAAAALGAETKVTASAGKLLEFAPGSDLVIVDLGTAGGDATALLTKLRSLDPPPRRIIAFGPHVHDDLLAAARSAGCEVFTRGQFFSRMKDVLAGK